MSGTWYGCKRYNASNVLLCTGQPRHQCCSMQMPSFDDQLKPVSGGGNFHVLPLKALLGTTPPSTCQHQPLKFSKAVFSFADDSEEPKSPGPATTLTLVRIRGFWCNLSSAAAYLTRDMFIWCSSGICWASFAPEDCKGCRHRLQCAHAAGDRDPAEQQPLP